MNVKQRVVVVAAGALGGLALLGGVAMAQTPSSTPATPAATPTAAAAPDGQAPRQGEDCPEKEQGTQSGTSTSGFQRAGASRT